MIETEAYTDKQAQINQFIKAERRRLLPILCLYVVRAELAAIERSAKPLAAELLDNLMIEALDHADQFDPSHRPFAWLLGMASRLVQRRREGLGKHVEPEQVPGGNPMLSEDEVIDHLPRLFGKKPAQAAKQDRQLFELLNHVSQEDQRVLRLAAHHEFDGETLAKELGMPPGAARVRLHRALDHLRSEVQE